jgi:hypothetical protein
MRTLILLGALFITAPASAQCHRYALWRYPYPQHCEVRAEVLRPFNPPLPPARRPISFERVLTSFFDMGKATQTEPEWLDWAGRLYYIGE